MNCLVERSEVRTTTPERWIIAQQEQAAELEQWVLPPSDGTPALTIIGFDSALDDEGREKQFVQFELYNHTTETEYQVQIAAAGQGQWSLVMSARGTVSTAYSSFDDAFGAAYLAAEQEG